MYKMAFICLLILYSSQSISDSKVCNGKFANPITDYCWSCVFPIKIAGADLGLIGGQEDKDSNTDAICTCGDGADTLIGTSTSFWEPTTMVDVVRKPFCLAGLGGIDLGDVIDAPPAGFNKIDGGAITKEAFYQVHWYVNPVLHWLQIIVDSSCIDNLPFDLSYLTEVDPLWNDEEMTTILNPDVFLYANPAAQLACAADCVVASAGFPNPATYWCAGCQGSMFPLTGKVKNHTGLVDSSSLLLQKFTHKAHRELMIWGASGKAGMCYKYPKYLMDRTDYKYSMLFPVPQEKINGKCCQPFGRTTVLWGSGKSFPFYGEDAVYQIFRKRDCCVGATVTNMVN
jgi:conjugal transfer pilus assembly protein TraU